MNRYALWKYLIIAVALLFGGVYTAPNFFGEAPAVQVSAAKPTVKVDPGLVRRVEDVLKVAKLDSDGVYYDTIGQLGTVRARFKDTTTQFAARDALDKSLNAGAKSEEGDYTVASSLVSRSPRWLTSIQALPMYLGLDLRGGVHFLFQVNTDEALEKRLDTLATDLRTLLREKSVRHAGIARSAGQIEIRFREADMRVHAEDAIRAGMTELSLREEAGGDDLLLVATLTISARRDIASSAIKQNITTLQNRVNELGVAEPTIQQQGADRIVVQLPGVQDVARAKRILGRTATLEIRLVDDTKSSGITVPDRSRTTEGPPVMLKRDIAVTGTQLVNAQAGIDQQTQQPIVSVRLNEAGGRSMRAVTRDNLGKLMAIVLYERGKGEAISVATIRGEFGNQFQISGSFSVQESNDLALLIRAGSLAAPMEIVEERLIGPSLGEENIRAGFLSTVYGFSAIAVFMILYYRVFGLISVVGLSVNLMLLIGLLSVLQATLTLPGIAAIALTLGMAIDANVLINERVREELRGGRPPQQAIHEGYEKAFATIIDSNITTLIAGIFLFLLGSGPVRGFAVVHCLGILTSIFSAVFVSRGIVNLVYGARKKLAGLSVGQVWRPNGSAIAKA